MLPSGQTNKNLSPRKGAYFTLQEISLNFPVKLSGANRTVAEGNYAAGAPFDWESIFGA